MGTSPPVLFRWCVSTAKEIAMNMFWISGMGRSSSSLNKKKRRGYGKSLDSKQNAFDRALFKLHKDAAYARDAEMELPVLDDILVIWKTPNPFDILDNTPFTGDDLSLAEKLSIYNA